MPRPGGSRSGPLDDVEAAHAIDHVYEAAAIAEHVGIHMTPHQFRHFAATSYLEANPNDHQTVQAMLHHASSKTTLIYAGSASRRASRAYGELLFEQRDKLKLHPAWRPFPPTKDAPMPIIAKLDELGTGAWIALSIIGFVFWWPVGLALLAFTIGSGRMSWWNHRSVARWQDRMERMQGKMDHMRDRMESSGGGWWGGPPSSGNRAFDEYRAETLRRLEEEQREFREFLQRLRQAKDKAEFDMFMAERRNRDGRAGDVPQPQG